MSNVPWSRNPNAPKISSLVYHDEKANFAGALIASMLYGTAVILFFKCMTALCGSVYRKGEQIKWGFVSYTVVIFSALTVQTAMNLDILSISYIDNRNYSGGPWGYQSAISREALSIVPNFMFPFCSWLADGLLLYRCYVLYKNVWVLVFPCLMYLGSVAMGIAFVWQARFNATGWAHHSYFSISLALNVILTCLIVVRLIMHTRSTRSALGLGGPYKAIVVMLVESSALYAVASLLVIGTWAANHYMVKFFKPILWQIQVIAPLLVILRVADKSALTSSAVVPGGIPSSNKPVSWGQYTGGSDTLTGANRMSSVDQRGVNSFGLQSGVETAIESPTMETHPYAYKSF